MATSDKPLVGVMGGTFDPVHFGHLHAAFELCHALSFDHVRLVPCFKPVHRDEPIAGPVDRLGMLKVAVEGVSELVVDDIEFQRDSPSFSFDTLVALGERLPDVQLCLVLGSDCFNSFASWYRWEEILDLVPVVVIQRPGEVLQSDDLPVPVVSFPSSVEVRQRLFKEVFPCVISFDVAHFDVSASGVRQCFSEGLVPHFLLPRKVIDYVQSNRLYNCRA